jgi:hypothetical protein
MRNIFLKQRSANPASQCSGNVGDQIVGNYRPSPIFLHKSAAVIGIR